MYTIKEEHKDTYPRLVVSKNSGAIILMRKEGHGFVIHNDDGGNIGFPITGLDVADYEDFRGTITIGSETLN